MEKILDIRSLGVNVKKFREERGLTAESLAELAGVSKSHINNIESASTRASAEIIIRIANSLDVSVDVLIADSLSGENQKRARVMEYFYILEGCEDWEARLINKMAQALKEELHHNKRK